MEPVGSTEQELTNEQFCDGITGASKLVGLAEDKGLVKNVPVSGSCTKLAGSNFTYFGSTAPAKFAASGVKLEGKAMYCALKSAHGARAEGFWNQTKLGRFGAATDIRVTKSDPATMTVNTQRVGTVYMFGVGLAIDNNPMDWRFPSETQNLQSVRDVNGNLITVPAQVGQYASMATRSINWSVRGLATVSLGLIDLLLGASYGNTGYYTANNNRAYVMTNSTPNDVSIENRRRITWDSFLSQCQACMEAVPPGGFNFCSCPTAADWASWNRGCGPTGCTAAYYANLSDQRLPHDGRRGATGPFFDIGRPNDFWHSGRPGPGSRVLGTAVSEGISSLERSATASSSAFNLTFGFGYDLAFAHAALKINAVTDIASGMAVRDYRHPFRDTEPTPLAVEVGVGAQAAFGIETQFIIRGTFPLIGTKTLLDERITVQPRTVATSPAKLASEITWDERADGSGALHTFVANGAAQSLDACLAAPAAQSAPLEMGDPEAFISKVRIEAEKKLHPCNVNVCVPTAANGSGRLKVCTWDAVLQKLNCTQPNTPCLCRDTRADLCDNSGNVYRTTQQSDQIHFACPRVE